MKYLCLAIIVLSFTLGACAHHDTAATTTTQSTATSTGYSK